MLSIFFLLGLVVVGCKGQTNKIFQWQFQNQVLSTQLGTCVDYPIVVKPYDATGNSTGVPPYYMISFPIGGIPIRTSIGSDPGNLLWTVTQPVGSSLLLSVVDSTGSAGGIPPQLLTVIAGQTTQCVSTAEPDSPFTITANVTENLETCQPWGITVSGGVPPYNITLAETNQPVVTNVTMPFGDNRFTYINRALPTGGQLIVAVSDFEGRWAKGTPVVTPIGSSDTNCTGLVSSSGNATVIDAQDAVLNAQLTANKRHKSLVTGVAVTLVLLLVIACSVMWYLRYRRRTQIIRRRVSEQRVRQYATIDDSSSSSAASGSTQIWETFDTTVRPFEAAPRAPVYGKQSRIPREMSPAAVSEPDVEAPPYQEIEPNVVSLGGVTAGGSSLPSTFSRVAVYEKSLPSSRQGLPRLMAATARSRSSLPQSSPSSTVASQPSPGPTGASSASTTTSEMVSAFPEAPISIPTKTPSIPPRPSRKTSAGFVTFPQKSVRVSALSDLSATPSEGDKGADDNSVPRSTRTIQPIAEEDTVPPRYRSGSQ